MAAVLAALGSTVFIFAASQIWLGNADEFTTPLSVLIGAGVLVVGSVCLLGTGVSVLMSDRAARRAEFVIGTLALLCWTQSTFLIWDYGVLDGRPIPWGEMVSRGLIDSVLWIVGLLIAFYCSIRVGQTIVKAAFVVAAIQAITLANLWIAVPTETTTEARTADPKAMFEFSPGTNILHIVMDGFQSDIFADIVKSEQVPDIQQELEGFTFFKEHTGTFPYTQLTMPLIVSGSVYQNDVSVSEFTARVARGPNVLNAAIDAGLEVDIAAQPSILSVYAQNRHTRTYTIPGNLHAKQVDYFAEDSLRLIDYSLFRVSPHFLRFLIHQDELWLFQRFLAPGSYPNLRYFSDIEFLRQGRSSMSVSREKPAYKLFHLMISHRPTVGTPDCEFDGIKKTSRSTVTDQSVCGLKTVVAVLNRMKELGIYDDSLIVLMADHGAWVGPKGYGRANRDHDGPNSSVAGLAVPLLAVKPPSAEGPLIVSEAPSNIGDVAQTIATLATLNVDLPGNNVFELNGDNARSRYFYDYAYGDNSKMKGYLYTMLEYRIEGSPFNEAAWAKNRRILPGGAVESAQSD